MHREMRLRQLSSHRILPILSELVHTVTLMAYDNLAAAWQGTGGHRDPMQLLVLTGGMMSLQVRHIFYFVFLWLRVARSYRSANPTCNSRTATRMQ